MRLNDVFRVNPSALVDGLRIGLFWAVAWGGAGVIVALGFVLASGSRPDPPVPLMMSVLGFSSGILFVAVQRLLRGNCAWEQVSLAWAAGCGIVAGFLLAGFMTAGHLLAGDWAFIGPMLLIGPLLATFAAISAMGTILLLRRRSR